MYDAQKKKIGAKNIMENTLKIGGTSFDDRKLITT